jgi:hypothetical protein
MITYNLLDKYKEIAHFCTSRNGGVSMGNYASFNLSPFSGDNTIDYSENRKLLCNKLGIDYEKLIIPFQTHGTEIRQINEDFFQLNDGQKSACLDGIDALITDQPGVCIGITTADCVPLLFFDPVKKVIAAAHAGWRGTCGKIAEKTIHTFIDKYNSNPSDILVTIGPSISAEAYEVGNELVEKFDNAGFDISEIVYIKNQSIFLDLWKANQQLLENLGILTKNIEIAGICTYTEDQKFFSARKLGINSGRMLNGIMLVK